MGFVGWAVVLTCLFVGATSFFSACANALRIFSRVRLQEELKAATGQERPDLVEKIAGDADRLVLACGVYRLVFNIGALLLLVALLSKWHGTLDATAYLLVFAIALAIFSVFSLAIPYAWAKYAGEKLISRTYGILAVFALLATPILWILRLYDGFVRRLAGVPQEFPVQRADLGVIHDTDADAGVRDPEPPADGAHQLFQFRRIRRQRFEMVCDLHRNHRDSGLMLPPSSAQSAWTCDPKRPVRWDKRCVRDSGPPGTSTCSLRSG